MDKNSKIYVAGHTGLVGSAIVRCLQKNGYHNLVLRTHKELDLTKEESVQDFFERERPDYVFIAAGLVGGIKANSEAPVDFFTINMKIVCNILYSAYITKVKKLLYLGSACMYPKECTQPMQEEQLLTGLPEITNEGYALAKICGCRLCSYYYQQWGANFISTIPANTYGINDCFDPGKSHVIPALLTKYHHAKRSSAPHVILWGTGKVLREFIFVDDLADGCLFLMEHYEGASPINMGSGCEYSIMDISQMIKRIVGYDGEIVCDPTKPDGMMRRMIDSSKIQEMGWHAKTDMESGLRQVYQWYLNKETEGK